MLPNVRGYASARLCVGRPGSIWFEERSVFYSPFMVSDGATPK